MIPLVIHPTDTTEQLVTAGCYEYANPLINSQTFPHNTRRWFLVSELLCFNEPLANPEVSDRLAERGFEPSGMTELLTLRTQSPRLDLQDPIVALNAVLTKPDGQRFIGCMFEFAGEPNLGVIWERPVWSARYRFLVNYVQP